MNEVDRYEYNLKLEEIDKLVDQRDYNEAAKLADTIDWKRVRNTRTLCLVSEIYEAADRPEDSKTLLERAYRRLPVGRTVLYRLVEVTILLHQYDEAMEYYNEYVNIAPNDTNRFILKYRICRGRGDSPEELIPILEEYASLEYTEQWTYELARLYQQAGQMQKCLAMCDDLVLWFHSGKYVLKALELKKKYAKLTPKQEEIYNEQFVRPAEIPEEENPEPEEKADDMPTTAVPEVNSEAIAATIIASTEKEIAGEVAAHKAELEQAELEQAEPDRNGQGMEEIIVEPAAADSGEDSQEELSLQVELARSMREIIAGVVKRAEVPEEFEEPEAPVIPKKLEEIPEAEPSEETEENRLSIDDILLSMGEKGRALAQNVQETPQDVQEEPEPDKDGEEDGIPLTSAQEEALQYMGDSEKPLPVYEDSSSGEGPQKTNRAGKESREGILKEKTIRVPTEKIASLHARYGVEELWEEQARWMKESASVYEEKAKDAEYSPSEESGTGEIYETVEESDGSYGDDGRYASAGQQPEEYSAAEDPGVTYELTDEDEPDGQEEEFLDDEDEEFETGGNAAADQKPEAAGEGALAENGEEGANGGERTVPAKEGPLLPDHIRGFFEGFTEIEGLEQQIANAVFQAVANSGDRTSRTGNILIFGPHGSGKTTLAVNIAKAVAQDLGNDTLKVARIYAADFNRKDIAATVAKIAGGTLIIEEAGDLDTNAIEQLTTAMEFRTDGMLVILEDEQQYIHDLLMSNPRFTMKFTAQIYLPVYTAQELVMFAQLYAGGKDYVISEEGQEILYGKISATAEQGNNVSIANVVELTERAIRRSNKLLRRMAMGRKRYDENDFIVLYARDFK